MAESSQPPTDGNEKPISITVFTGFLGSDYLLYGSLMPLRNQSLTCRQNNHHPLLIETATQELQTLHSEE
ncbi:hypothetical protein BC938DRAFT_470624 [Jimgerdemannia flammicorona]|uniref:Uncharacterized protein n=1 Tax=Jimgerdemannia flammicorona TaxID=994334 RepID=A0A433QV30_9FUNG|nr:hypothetical protein BC938DRAFT_470624 [Jimgerdemannia flammicorona]